MRSSNFIRRGVLVWGLVWQAWALDPARNATQYVRQRWGVEQGLPSGPIYTMAQGQDGYLWIGTESGLVRFDGIGFEVRQEKSPLRTAVTHVLGLLPAAGGGLWVRMRRPAQTLLRWDGGGFRPAFASSVVPQPSVAAMAQKANGDLLIWGLRGEPFAGVLRGGQVERLAAPEGFSRSPVLCLLEDRKGDLWVGTRDAGLYRVRGGLVEAVREGLPDAKVNALALGRQGELWVGTDAGLARWDGKRLVEVEAARELRGVPVLSLEGDRNGNLWAGTHERGLWRMNDKGSEWMDGPEARGRQAITALLEDREGNLWVGSGSGLERIRDSAFVSITTAEGLPARRHGAIAVDAEGGVWGAPIRGGLWRRKDGELRNVAEEGLAGDVVYSMATNAEGVWLGRQSGRVTWLDARTRRGKSWELGDSVFAIHCTRGGAVWAGTLSRGAFRWSQGRWEEFGKQSPLESNTVQAIYESADGALWFATPHGVREHREGRWKKHALQGVNCFAEDRQGALWAGGDGGMFRWDGEDWRPLLQSPQSVRGMAMDAYGDWWVATTDRVMRLGKEGYREYRSEDGLRSNSGVKRQHSVYADGQGRIWFASNDGVAYVDPKELRENSPLAIPKVQAVVADGQEVPNAGRAPEGTQRLVLRLAGLFLGAPQEVHYRYRLDGFDEKWSEVTSAREALYTNLPPRDYHFRLQVRNPEGNWNPEEATVQFTMMPRYWQTWWFRLGVVGGLAGLVALAWHWRLRKWRQEMQLRFEERLAERTRIAQELHDTLLQGCLGASMQLHVATEALPVEAPQRKALERVGYLLSQVTEQGRNALRGLRSEREGKAGLAKELADAPATMGFASAARFQVVVDGEVREMEVSAREEIYRIGREAIVNAFRHAAAESVEVELFYAPRKFRMRVRDDGRGMEPQVLEAGKPGHWGLAGMRERARRFGAELTVRSRSGAGTVVELAAPGVRVYARGARPKWWERLGRWRKGKEAL